VTSKKVFENKKLLSAHTKNSEIRLLLLRLPSRLVLVLLLLLLLLLVLLLLRH
jgi:hypothetical protein